VKDRVIHLCQQLRAEVKDRTVELERRVKAIQQKLDRLDEAFLYAQAIDITSYERQRDKLRAEVTLAQIDYHAESLDALDVEGILAFAERVLPRASALWVQPSLNQRQRLQQLFFPQGVAFDENQFNRTAATAPFFKYLARSERAEESGEPPRNRTENPQIKSSTRGVRAFRPCRFAQCFSGLSSSGVRYFYRNLAVWLSLRLSMCDRSVYQSPRFIKLA
jgi:hypothetical protein